MKGRKKTRDYLGIGADGNSCPLRAHSIARLRSLSKIILLIKKENKLDARKLEHALFVVGYLPVTAMPLFGRASSNWPR